MDIKRVSDVLVLLKVSNVKIWENKIYFYKKRYFINKIICWICLIIRATNIKNPIVIDVHKQDKWGRADGRLLQKELEKWNPLPNIIWNTKNNSKNKKNVLTNKNGYDG